MLRASGFDAGCMLGNLAAEAAPLSPPIRAQVAALFAHWTRALAAAIEAGRADGSLRPTLPAETLASFLVAAWEGAVQRAKADQDEAPFDAFFAVLDPLLG
jgi:TetR/AcrR family transcriptional repressor of nem operon